MRKSGVRISLWAILVFVYLFFLPEDTAECAPDGAWDSHSKSSIVARFLVKNGRAVVIFNEETLGKARALGSEQLRVSFRLRTAVLNAEMNDRRGHDRNSRRHRPGAQHARVPPRLLESRGY